MEQDLFAIVYPDTFYNRTLFVTDYDPRYNQMMSSPDIVKADLASKPTQRALIIELERKGFAYEFQLALIRTNQKYYF
ncbi:hypothetical protein MFLO_12326 [Listeria floridensis FSL S10-1187]|uniref:Uncharacterized protein n=1 Tax=Listeria floridensis FSL S10-1187 TaxID=1265817 RepID=A0ABN0RDA2_9LIST|nr:hypothetical protein [Listeria floridensis]EUJ28525.1 hypothetical protein MFLO_12326 [Listeria floridensis FSL S10-1187]